MKRAKRGDLMMNLLYQVYDSGRAGTEEGMGSFIENVAIKILNLIDAGVLKKGSTYSNKEFTKYNKVEHPISTPSWSVKPKGKGKK